VGPRLRLGAALLLVAGCSGAPSPLDTRGPGARGIAELTVILLGLSALVFLVVEGLLVVAVIRFRRRDQPGEPPQIYGDTPLEATWTAVPAIILAVLLVVTLHTMAAVAGPGEARTRGDMTIRVIGHQWWWEVRYPAAEVVTANEIHIPVEAPVRIDLTSVDVIHSFWVPQLQGKMDVIPGRINSTWLQADQIGTYRGQCSEFCGVQHAHMAFLVVAEPLDQFQAWLAAQRAAAEPPTDAFAQQGVQTFARVGCISCHTIRWGETGAGGSVGPDLTHVASRRTIAAGTLANTPGNLAGWIANPQSIKPGSGMPDLDVSGDDLGALVALLRSLD
jgi:cytochrome c oxidase subunit II